MKNMIMEISNVDYLAHSFAKVEELKILVKGELNCGNKYEINAEFSDIGSLKKFNLYNKDYNTIDFYIEIAEIVKHVKDLEGQRILDMIKKIKDIKNEYNEKQRICRQEHEDSIKKHKILSKELDDLTLQYKKSRGSNRININNLLMNKQYEVNNAFNLMFEKEDEINKLHDEMEKQMQVI